MFNFTDKTILKTSPTALYKEMAIKLEGEGPWIEWEPETILHSISSDIGDVAMNKILAVQAVAANTELPCMDHVAFESVVNSFCNYTYIVGESQPTGIEECFYTVNHIKGIATQVHNLDPSSILFAGEVPGYIAAVAKLYSKRVIPYPLSFAQDILDFIYLNYNIPLDEMKDIVQKIDSAIIPENVKDISSLVEELDPKSEYHTFITWILGCYIYDPTSNKW